MASPSKWTVAAILIRLVEPSGNTKSSSISARSADSPHAKPLMSRVCTSLRVSSWGRMDTTSRSYILRTASRPSTRNPWGKNSNTGWSTRVAMILSTSCSNSYCSCCIASSAMRSGARSVIFLLLAFFGVDGLPLGGSRSPYRRRNRTGCFARGDVEDEHETLPTHEEGAYHAELEDLSIAEVLREPLVEICGERGVDVPQDEQLCQVKHGELFVREQSWSRVDDILELFLGEAGIQSRLPVERVAGEAAVPLTHLEPEQLLQPSIDEHVALGVIKEPGIDVVGIEVCCRRVVGENFDHGAGAYRFVDHLPHDAVLLVELLCRDPLQKGIQLFGHGDLLNCRLPRNRMPRQLETLLARSVSILAG